MQGASVDSMPLDRTDADYKRLRRQVFLAIFVGYAAYYLVRMNFSLAIPDILREFPEYTKAQLGTAMTALSIAYGVSKFLMGSVSIAATRAGSCRSGCCCRPR
jgi:MFS transporter, OPA family, glycerol-3-phosphate transporter